MSKGIDVSRWQGVIDWTRVKASGIEFAIIKAGGSDDGFYKDGKFERNYANAKKVGMPIGTYYFVGKKCITKEAGVADAKRFIAMLTGKTFEYPVYMDIESTETKDKAGATDAAIAFCKTMEAAGYYVGIYASDISGFVERLDQTRLTAFDKWVARYGSEPKFVKSYGIWQHGDNGRVPGIVGNVDMDIAYRDYPYIIKKKGLNGFGKVPVNTKPVQPKPEPVVEKATPIKEIRASGMAQKFDKTMSGSYKTVSALNLRDNAGIKYKSLFVIPKGTAVNNYGYYSELDGIKWLYIQFTIDNIKYTGFASGKYLVK